ncbi:hypothetical protein [Streptomyces sp. NPDC002788]
MPHATTSTAYSANAAPAYVMSPVCRPSAGCRGRGEEVAAGLVPVAAVHGPGGEQGQERDEGEGPDRSERAAQPGDMQRRRGCGGGDGGGAHDGGVPVGPEVTDGQGGREGAGPR